MAETSFTAALTEAERATIDAAAVILLSRLPVKASLAVYTQNYHGTPGLGVTFFDTNGEQHSEHAGRSVGYGTLADKVDAAIAIQRNADENEGAYRALRAAKLREELAALEQAA